MVDEVRIMILAAITSVLLMMLFARPIGEFVSHHPTVKMLGLSFRVVIGLVLIAEGLHHHVPKGCLYFAMASCWWLSASIAACAGQAINAPHSIRQRFPATEAAGVWSVATKTGGN
jgi:predicted tellurium resistance membrane protein TerC